MRKLFLVAVAAISLGACSTLKAGYDAVTTQIDMTSVRKTALSVDIAYQAALELANVYAAFPKCGSAVAPLCADPSAVKAIVDLDAKAAPLVDAMNKTVQDPNADASIASAAVVAATNAVEALKAAIPAATPAK